MVLDMSDTGGLASYCEPMQQSEAEHIVEKYYGKQGVATKFETEKDDTFKVSTGDNSVVLKVANPSEDFGELDFQNSILKHIENHDPSLPIPRIIKNNNDEDIFQITDDAGQNRFVRMFSYLQGTPLDLIESEANERFKVGCILGRLRYATSNFHHPHEGRELAWDVKHLLKLTPLLNQIECETQRSLLEEGINRFATLNSEIATCRTQVLHNDFSKSNIVVDKNSPDFVTGIIDFGDAVHTSIAIDVSTALLNQLPLTSDEDMFSAGRDLLQGYLSVAELKDEELRLIPHLVMGRVIARALLTIWRAKKFPENKTYILRNTDRGWHQLRWFLNRPMDQVSETLI